MSACQHGGELTLARVTLDDNVKDLAVLDDKDSTLEAEAAEAGSGVKNGAESVGELRLVVGGWASAGVWDRKGRRPTVVDADPQLLTELDLVAGVQALLPGVNDEEVVDRDNVDAVNALGSELLHVGDEARDLRAAGGREAGVSNM